MGAIGTCGRALTFPICPVRKLRPWSWKCNSTSALWAIQGSMQAIPQQISIGPTRILIVEDHHDSREALSALLRAFGYDVTEAQNGREAILRAASDRPGLILMDIMMPELDGFNAARAIRAIPGLEQVPIIAVTAIDNAEQQALQAGMTDFVCKPVDIQGLLAKVSGWIKASAV